MEDKELLEKAAKSAGYGLPSADDHDEIDRQYCRELGLWVSFNGWWRWFRPLKSDGDAQRLRNKLRMDVLYTDQGVNVACDDVLLAFEPWGGDDLETERRAITRAAAAMVKE